MTLVLSYEPVANITTGFLGCGPEELGKHFVSLRHIILQMVKFDTCIIRPMALPVLIYAAWCFSFGNRLQKETMNPALAVVDHRLNEYWTTRFTTEQCRAMLILLHAMEYFFTDETCDFSKRLGPVASEASRNSQSQMDSGLEWKSSGQRISNIIGIWTRSCLLI
jgi:hypothetical protein